MQAFKILFEILNPPFFKVGNWIVPIQRLIFYSNRYVEINEGFEKCKKSPTLKKGG
jgi:hypothetical protein